MTRYIPADSRVAQAYGYIIHDMGRLNTPVTDEEYQQVAEQHKIPNKWEEVKRMKQAEEAPGIAYNVGRGAEVQSARASGREVIKTGPGEFLIEPTGYEKAQLEKQGQGGAYIPVSTGVTSNISEKKAQEEYAAKKAQEAEKKAAETKTYYSTYGTSMTPSEYAQAKVNEVVRTPQQIADPLLQRLSQKRGEQIKADVKTGVTVIAPIGIGNIAAAKLVSGRGTSTPQIGSVAGFSEVTQKRKQINQMNQALTNIAVDPLTGAPTILTEAKERALQKKYEEMKIRQKYPVLGNQIIGLSGLYKSGIERASEWLNKFITNASRIAKVLEPVSQSIISTPQVQAQRQAILGYEKTIGALAKKPRTWIVKGKPLSEGLEDISTALSGISAERRSALVKSFEKTLLGFSDKKRDEFISSVTDADKKYPSYYKVYEQHGLVDKGVNVFKSLRSLGSYVSGVTNQMLFEGLGKPFVQRPDIFIGTSALGIKGFQTFPKLGLGVLGFQYSYSVMSQPTLGGAVDVGSHI